MWKAHTLVIPTVAWHVLDMDRVQHSIERPRRVRDQCTRRGKHLQSEVTAHRRRRVEYEESNRRLLPRHDSDRVKVAGYLMVPDGRSDAPICCERVQWRVGGERKRCDPERTVEPSADVVVSDRKARALGHCDKRLYALEIRRAPVDLVQTAISERLESYGQSIHPIN